MGHGTWYYSLGVSSIVNAFVRSEFGISSWRDSRVDGRSYLQSGVIDGSEANGIIRDPKSCKVRVSSNGNLWWEASVLLGRKKGGELGMCIDYLKKSEIENSHVMSPMESTKEEHVSSLGFVLLELLRKEKLLLYDHSSTSVNFGCKEVHFLGHVVNQNGLSWVQSVIIDGLSQISFPKLPYLLPSLNQKNHVYVWGVEQEEAFQTLKNNLYDAPILTLTDAVEDFMVYCDVSNQGLGCVLMQIGKVIAYASQG
ncbi:putative reverse transcriptase domain-containing protein [Tanacetum coccineum]